MASALHTVAELPQFLRDAAAIGLSDDEHQAIVDTVARDPKAGDEVRGSGGVRKIRIAGRGKGKSGGYRVNHGLLWPRRPGVSGRHVEQGRAGKLQRP